MDNIIFAVELHMALNFGGFVTATLNTRNHTTYSLKEVEGGIRVQGAKCNKFIPWANIKGVDYVLENGEVPVAGDGKI